MKKCNGQKVGARPEAAQQCYCTRIATLPFSEIGRACGVAFALKAHVPARNRVNSGVIRNS